jgi:hypothetical protein
MYSVNPDTFAEEEYLFRPNTRGGSIDYNPSTGESIVFNITTLRNVAFRDVYGQSGTYIEVWTGVNGAWDFGNPNTPGSGRIRIPRVWFGPSDFPVGPLYLAACVRNRQGSGSSNEVEYKVRVRGSGTAPFKYTIPTGFN